MLPQSMRLRLVIKATTHEVECKPLDRVGALRKKIMDSPVLSAGLPLVRPKLIYNGMKLEDSDVLADVGLNDGDRILVILGIETGACDEEAAGLKFPDLSNFSISNFGSSLMSKFVSFFDNLFEKTPLAFPLLCTLGLFFGPALVLTVAGYTDARNGFCRIEIAADCASDEGAPALVRFSPNHSSWNRPLEECLLYGEGLCGKTSSFTQPCYMMSGSTCELPRSSDGGIYGFLKMSIRVILAIILAGLFFLSCHRSFQHVTSEMNSHLNR